MGIILIFLVFVSEVWTVSSSYFSEIENCRFTTHGKEYVGYISRTENENHCLEWSMEMLMHLQLDKRTYFDIDPLLDQNYCRNPTNFPNGPWCFVDSITLEWEYCNIPKCVTNINRCKDSTSGVEYMGKINFSKSGKVCKSWQDQDSFSINSFQEESLKDAENFCRNPNSSNTVPWCYIENSMQKLEDCDVPMCDRRFSPIEYFGMLDTLKTIKDNVIKITLDHIYQFAMFFIELESELWKGDVKKKTFLWSTTYNVNCQSDLDEYEFCQIIFLKNIRSLIDVTYKCFFPFKTFILISPLLKSQYNIRYELGPKFEINNKPSQGFLEYEEKVIKYFSRHDRNGVPIPITNNHGHFYLVNDNAFSYAVASGNRTVITVSEIGEGLVSFIASEGYLEDKFRTSLSDLLYFVNSREVIFPKILTADILKKIDYKRRVGEHWNFPMIWNAHKTIGKDSIKLLLNLIGFGLRVVIGIKPWAYHYYVHRLEDCELKTLFIASGIWPSTDSLSEKLERVKGIYTQILPLTQLLDYASFNVENGVKTKDLVSNIFRNIPLDDFSRSTSFIQIRKTILKLYFSYIHYAKSIIPCIDQSITSEKERIIIGIINAILILPIKLDLAAPGVSFYPGMMQSENVKTIQMKLNLLFKDEVVQLGLYVNPSTDVSVEISMARSSKCQLHVNHHLFTINHKNEWIKWPTTQISFSLLNNNRRDFSLSFGGLLSLSCTEDGEVVNMIIAGVNQVPMFDRRDKKTIREWHKSQLINAPWAVLAGDTVVFVVSSSAIRNLGQPENVLRLYDFMVKEEMHLRGKAISNHRRQVVSTDIQILAGYMHSGYPVGTTIADVANPTSTSYLFNEGYIKKKGAWGILHEIGHNLQDPLFTFIGTEEVTNNILTLVAVQTITGEHSWSPTEGWLKDRNRANEMVDYISNGAFSQWLESPFLALGIYAQLQNSFGWELYSQVFRRYNTLIDYKMKISNSEKIQLWINETSHHASMNLCPVYDLWRWPIDKKTNEYLSKLPYFMPDDFLTKSVESRVEEIVKKYGGHSKVSRKPKPIKVIVGPLKNKFSVEGKRIIEKLDILNK